ncbi:hypothetical protein GX865_00030 [Candidatus Saccharibacteria bacterium]|nr:hypothetical protein [Candidatus Saccharibacteria bacterium]
MSYACKVLLDSVSSANNRLTTMEVTLPRFLLAEFNTHRMFSRNSASSRAIPIKKQIERIKTDPFIPEFWGRAKPGMQAGEQIDEGSVGKAKEAWLSSMSHAIAAAEHMDTISVHKQTATRILEPYMWQTIIVSATEWSNFFALRNNELAQPEFQKVAQMMEDEYVKSTPALLEANEWHMPLIQPDELKLARESPDLMCMVSAARCARVSYLTHDGNRDIEKDLELYARLVDGSHLSPLEHVARPSHFIEEDGLEYWEGESIFIGNFRGWKQLRKHLPYEDDFSKTQGR